MSTNKQMSFRKVAPVPQPTATQPSAPIEVETVTGGGNLPAAASTVVYDPSNPTNPDPAVGNLPAPYVPPAAQDRTFSPDNLDDVFELKLPALNIVQGVGDLSQSFHPGSIVMNKTLELAGPPAKQPKDAPQVPVEIVIIGSRRVQYVQKLSSEQFSAGESGARYASESEVYANGGTTDWATAKQTGRPMFEKLVSCLVLVRKPDHVEDLSMFPMVVKGADGKPQLWGAALIHFRGVQYNNAFTTILTSRRTGTPFDLRTIRGKGGFHNRALKLTTYLKSFPGNRSCFLWLPSDGGPANAEAVAEGYALVGQPSPIEGVVAPSQRPEAPAEG